MLDESVVNILREEAEREARARKDEAAALESQEELGLAISATVAASAAYDAAEDAEGAEGADTAGGAKGSRRNRLPDVDQITSTLRALPDHTAQSEEEEPYDPARRLGFRRGFVSVFVLSLSMLVIYLSAPQLAVRFPGYEPTLATYVVNVDRGRLWLDDRVKSVSAWMQGEPQTIEN